MRIVVLSDERMPSSVASTGGLSRSLWDLADGLAARGHTVTLVAAPGSAFERGTLLRWGAPLPDADVVLDGSHAHALSAGQPDAPIVNRIGDLECAWQPPNAVVASAFMQARYPAARILRTGVRDEAPARLPAADGTLVYMSGAVAHKGPGTAREVAAQAGMLLSEYGAGTLYGPVRGAEKWRALAGARALLHPSTLDAAPRLPLEAATVGTPTICLDGDGAQAHVAHCVSGFVCADAAEMVEAARDAGLLDRDRVRAWVLEEHAFEAMIDAYEAALARVAEGERW